MQVVANEVQRVAAILGADYMRTTDISRLNVNVHYKSIDGTLMVYNGEGAINTQFPSGNSEPIDYIDTQIYFLVRATTIDMTGEEIDAQLQITKELANKFFLQVQTVVGMATMTLQPVEILDDKLIGHEMTIILNFYNEGC
jgi:hypothetical protein